MKLLFLSDDLNNEELVQPLCLVANQLQATLDCFLLQRTSNLAGESSVMMQYSLILIWIQFM
ncbi:hypothetical protein [Bacillus sp. JCM 19041]|uniref:hypothetical protein n=1 Tax=Bacillus sp. JCM 19041 TaxID=1460637 RepID=UPI0006D0969E